MKKQITKKLTLSGVFIAIGIILPIAFHAIEGGGSIFLPMHIPVLMAGFFLDWPYALAVGVLTPLLSSSLTGMPPLFPVLLFMIPELAVYGTVVSLLYRNLKMNVYAALIISMVCGRIIAGVVVWILTTFFMAKLPSPIVFVQGAILKGIPGIIIQLILIPAVVLTVGKIYPASQIDSLNEK